MNRQDFLVLFNSYTAAFAVLDEAETTLRVQFAQLRDRIHERIVELSDAEERLFPTESPTGVRLARDVDAALARNGALAS